MKSVRAICMFSLLLLAGVSAQAQKAPRIGYVYPAGGQQGHSFEVTIGGQFLAGVTDVYCTGGGVDAEVLSYERPMNGKETELLRERLKKLQEEVRSGNDVSTKRIERQDIADLKERLALFANGRTFNTAIAENVRVRITLKPDAKLGERELRVLSPAGLSNPLVFSVGQLSEFSEPAARGSLKAEIETRPGRDAQKSGEKVVTRVSLPSVLNGQIMAGEVDRFRFSARRGQKVLVAVSARKLIPYLPDAVPGWFQAAVAIYDANGGELAYTDDFRFNPDPTLCYQFSADGEYELAIRDAIYRGREDFVYRITVGEVPFITHLFPLGGTAGSQPKVELYGWNVCPPALVLDLRNSSPGPLPLVTTRDQLASNFVPFAIDALPDQSEKEPNNAAVAAQALSGATIVNGRIDHPGDLDLYGIQGKANDEIVAEVHARRLGSPVDSVLTLTSADGTVLGSNDDCEDKGAGLTTHHADSRLSVKLPADGQYFLSIRDAQRGGGVEYGYRLRVGPPEPGFELRVVPSSISGRAGEEIPVTVHALRKGYNGEISISLAAPTKGFLLKGGALPANKDSVKLTLMLPKATDEPVAVELEGRATIAGRALVRRAVPADDMQQAFAYRHLVPAKELLVAVRGKLTSGGAAKLMSEGPIQITPGKPSRVEVSAKLGERAGRIQLQLSDPPEGVAMRNVSVTPEGAAFDIDIDAAKSLAGETGRLQVQAFQLNESKVNGKRRRIALGPLPPIPFEVVQP